MVELKIPSEAYGMFFNSKEYKNKDQTCVFGYHLQLGVFQYQ